jgi:putative heme degradation protein
MFKPLATELNSWCNVQNPRFKLHARAHTHKRKKEERKIKAKEKTPNRAVQEWP